MTSRVCSPPLPYFFRQPEGAVPPFDVRNLPWQPNHWFVKDEQGLFYPCFTQRADLGTISARDNDAWSDDARKAVDLFQTSILEAPLEPKKILPMIGNATKHPWPKEGGESVYTIHEQQLLFYVNIIAETIKVFRKS